MAQCGSEKRSDKPRSAMEASWVKTRPCHIRHSGACRETNVTTRQVRRCTHHQLSGRVRRNLLLERPHRNQLLSVYASVHMHCREPLECCVTLRKLYFASGLRICSSSAWMNSLPQITSPVLSASSLPVMPLNIPPASRTMI